MSTIDTVLYLICASIFCSAYSYVTCLVQSFHTLKNLASYSIHFSIKHTRAIFKFCILKKIIPKEMFIFDEFILPRLY